MEEITEAVNNINISDSYKKNRIQVSNTKKPLFFYVNLAKVIGGSSFCFVLCLSLLLFDGFFNRYILGNCMGEIEMWCAVMWIIPFLAFR